MNTLERFHACVDYQDVDRAPYHDMGVWPETLEKWRQHGHSIDDAPHKSDRWEFANWFKPAPPFEYEVLEQDTETITYVNHEGIVMRERKDNPLSSMPQFLRFPVETRQDFRRFWADRMQPDLSVRIGPHWQQILAVYRNRDFPLIVFPDRWGGFFGPLRNLLGVENLCMMFHDDPAFVEEMMDANADFLIAMMDQILDHTSVDVFGFWEDMAYKAGPLLGPELARRYMLPRYRRVVDFLNQRGVKFICLDSDGDISKLIPIWLEAGINILYPFEVQCGMDVVSFRKEYGRDLRMWFGINKYCMAQGPAAIDAELARVEPLIRQGGYVPGPDHSIPPDITFENYCYFLEKLFAIL